MIEPTKRVSAEDLNLTEKLVQVARVAELVQRVKRFSFRALVVVGGGDDNVGVGLGKARVVPAAIRKGGAVARKALIKVPLRGHTIPHEVTCKFGASEVLLKPAAPGTGIIAGGGVRATLEAAGVKDVLTKSLGSSNQVNVVKATILALSQLKNVEEELIKRGVRIAPPAPQAAPTETVAPPVAEKAPTSEKPAPAAEKKEQRG